MTTTLHRIDDASAKRAFSGDSVRRTRLAGALAVLISIAGLAFANFAGSGENGGAAEYAVGVAVCAVLAAALFGRVLPAVGDPARAAWILAALALVSCLAFWSGLPFVLGMGAIYSASRAGHTAPAVVGALAVVAAFAACVVG